MKITLPFLVLIILSCNQSTPLEQHTIKNDSIDTIVCRNNRGLVQVNYYVDDRKVEYLPIGAKIRAVFEFEGNFKDILKKNGKFYLRSENDSISTIKKISANEFELVIHRNTSSGNLLYWMVMEAPNTLFEWSWIENQTMKYEYSEIWDVMKGTPIEKNIIGS